MSINMKSLICKYISNNINWQKDMEELKIKVKFSSNFAIFNYDIDADFSNPIVQEARGIVIDLNELKPVAWSFRKFGNYHESYADSIDWTTARVQDKLDGSIVRTWFNKYTNEWHWSTNGMINANEAVVNSPIAHNFLQLIKLAENYKDIDFDSLNKDYTYTFELVSPENQIVVKYDKTYLWHTGTRNNITGDELIVDIGIKHPKEYAVNNFDDCLKAAEALNKNDIVNYEGFVVVDKDWHRIKVKNTSYIFFHHFTNGQIVNKSIILEYLKSDDCDIDILIETFKDYEDVIRFYDSQIRTLEAEVQNFINNARKIYEQVNYDRKALAMMIKDHRFAGFGFKAVDSDLNAKELLNRCTKKTYESFIQDYKK